MWPTEPLGRRGRRSRWADVADVAEVLTRWVALPTARLADHSIRSQTSPPISQTHTHSLQPPASSLQMRLFFDHPIP